MKLYFESALRIKGRLLVCAGLVFALAWAALYMAKSGDYSSWATVWVEKPLYFNSDPGTNPYISPASNQSNLLSELLSTRQFTLNIAQEAQIPMPSKAAEDRVVTSIQRELNVEAFGTHLVRLSCTAGKDNYCKAVITQAIQLFIKQVEANRTRQAQVALQLYEGQLATYEQQMIQSRDAYNNYLIDNPDAGIGTVPNPTFAELQQQYGADRARYEGVLAKIEEIRTQSTAATEANNSFFRVMDPANDAVPYVFAMKDLLRNSLIALVMALFAMVAITLVSTWADPAVYTLNDINALVLTEDETSPELLISIVPYNRALANIRQRAARERKAEGRVATTGKKTDARQKSEIGAKPPPPTMQPGAARPAGQQ